MQSWRDSFIGKENYQNINLHIATARSGNVIGGGDWSPNRIIPDVFNSLSSSKSVLLRSPNSRRPWQHVLEPLRGYLLLAERLFEDNSLSQSFNFGPSIESNREVKNLVEEIFKHWSGDYICSGDLRKYYESKILHLQIEKSFRLLNWEPIWKFEKTIERTVTWYKGFFDGKDPIELCKNDLFQFYEDINKNINN